MKVRYSDLALAESFWRTQLKGFSTPTPFVIDHPTGVSGYGERSLSVPFNLLNSFARMHQITLNTLVQGAWALLLSRYSGESDVLFGATVSGRPPELAGVESMVGLFINTLPVNSRACNNAPVPIPQFS